VGSVESIRAVDEDTVGIVFDDTETFRPDLQFMAEDTGVSLSDVERTGENKTAVMARDQRGFFDVPGQEQPRDRRRVAPTDIHREPDGEFQRAPDALDPVPGRDLFRSADGEFVSADLEPAEEIGRRESNGFFDLLR
jgi:hypothetical protein